MNHTPFVWKPLCIPWIFACIYFTALKKTPYRNHPTFRLEKIAKKLQGFLHKSFRGAPVVGEPQPTEMTIISSIRSFPSFYLSQKMWKQRTWEKYAQPSEIYFQKDV